MAVQSRTEHSIRNTTVALVTQIVSVVLSFVTRTIFIILESMDCFQIS